MKILCLTLVAGLGDSILSPALAGILQPGQTLGFGDSGSQVTRLQEELRARGFYPGVATGNYFQQTTDAVTRYQRSVGLVADGIFGSATDAALFDGILPGAVSQLSPSAATRSPAATSAGDRTFSLGERLLRRGDRGPDVRELQQLLNDRFAPVSVDGIFGAGTEAVVLDFQRFSGLRADGIVGPSTIAALLDRPQRQVPQSQLPPLAVPGTRDGVSSSAGVGTSESRRLNENAQQINLGRYRVIIPTDPDNTEKLASTRVVVPSACLVRSRRGSYIFAGGYATHGAAETVRLALRSRRVRRNDADAPRLDARIDYKRGDFRDLECLR
ncbi:MAG: peptidoglycan-binding protein [Merismopedia sp. SIO2A8]|nr:peptidoglycan-binding protein [Symploca sp. SIO2B6]NET51037.1 peptidoglycan-binding protein [Merismopedia sp. SIO2A8]